jgi:hypothetical protein
LIGCESQTLGEDLPVAGTPFNLHYQSDRVPGRKDAYTLRNIRLSGPVVPDGLKDIRLEVSVAGRFFAQTFPAVPNQSYTFTWDGRDAYGRLIDGAQPVLVRVGYAYTPVYTRVPRFGYDGSAVVPGGITTTSRLGNDPVILWSVWKGTVGGFDAREVGPGGWMLDAHHVYDPTAHALYKGNGEVEQAVALPQGVISTFRSGTLFGGLTSLTAAPDGSFYYINGSLRVQRVAPNGIISTVGPGGYFGTAVGPDGSIYTTDQSANIRRIFPDGTVQLIPVGAHATTSLAISSDGVVYATDQLSSGNGLVWKLTPQGTRR